MDRWVYPLMLGAKAPSTITFEGGAHNPMAPPVHFIEWSFLPILARMGGRVDVGFERYGFYPAGGVSLLPVLSGLAQRFTPYQLRFCTGLASAYAPCGVISNNNGGLMTGFYSVKRFYRTNSVS